MVRPRSGTGNSRLHKNENDNAFPVNAITAGAAAAPVIQPVRLH